MAEPLAVASAAAHLPSSDDIARAEKFTRERFVHPGEEPEAALAPGTPRRNALDDALTQIDAGAKVPSTAWRRHYSLLLGLERVLSEEEQRLADGTLLNPHQVDALSGTLTALLAAEQTPANGNGKVATAAPVLSVEEDEPDVGDDEDDEDELDLDLDEPEEDEHEEDQSGAGDHDDDEQLAASEVDEDVRLSGEDDADDPNAYKRFWFEHATGAGKSVAALGFVEASRTGGVLILTHRRNLVDQFTGELTDRGYAKRISPALLGDADRADGPVTVETYQWFVRNAGQISSAYTIVICDEAHTALGEKTSAAIRQWTGPIFIGMTATGALIARHVTDLFPTQTSRFDLAQAARRGVIAPLRGIRIPPGPGVRTIAKVPLRRGDVDVEFDQEMLAELLDQLPFNLAIANLYKTRFNGVPGVVYAAGVRHAYNVAEAFRDEGMKAEAVSGETPKRQLAEILARYERGDIDVLVNAQLLAEGWNSPRATVCMHLAPTASKRIYQQRVGRVTRKHPGKEAGLVIDFVHPATKHDDPVVTLHSLLDRDVYRGGAIVVGPVRRGRGRRLRVERRVLPVVADENRRIEVFERELWRIAVEHLDYGEQIQWAALAGARVNPSGWRRARAMLHFDRGGELKRAFLLTAVQRNKNPQLRIKALQEIAASGDAEALDLAIDEIGKWSREEKREASKVMLQALAEKGIGRRDQANAWIWHLASYTRELHEEYAVARWPETKRLLGLLVNSSGAAHARNARRLVQAARKQDRRLSAAMLAAAMAHTAEGEEVLRGARTRMSRKPNSLARELLRNFPKARKSRNRRRKKKGVEGSAPQVATGVVAEANGDGGAEGVADGQQPTRSSRRNRNRTGRQRHEAQARQVALRAEHRAAEAERTGTPLPPPLPLPPPPPPLDEAAALAAVREAAGLLAAPPSNGGAKPRRSRAATRAPVAEAAEGSEEAPPKARRTAAASKAAAATNGDAAPKAPRARRTAAAKKAAPAEDLAASTATDVGAAPTAGEDSADPPAKAPRARRTAAAKKAAVTDSGDAAPLATDEAGADPPAKAPRKRKVAAAVDGEAADGEAVAPKRRSRAKKPADADPA